MVCDSMLEGLAKKLRLCGIDVIAMTNRDCVDDCAKIAINEKRYILTRGNNFIRVWFSFFPIKTLENNNSNHFF